MSDKIDWKDLKEHFECINKKYKTGIIKEDYYNAVNYNNIQDFTCRFINFCDKEDNYFLEREDNILYKRVVHYFNNILINPSCTVYVDLSEYKDLFHYIYLNIMSKVTPGNYNEIDLYLADLYLNEDDIKKFIFYYGNECISESQKNDLNDKIECNTKNKQRLRI